jgi:hypothetical protein
VARLVGRLDRQQLHHLAEVGVHPAEEARRHQQRRGLVLDQVGHHLDDRVLDLSGELERASHGIAVAGSHCAAAACA